jgi:hypothetical protein
MRTIKTKVYTFNELSEDAKANAIENCQDFNVDDDWWCGEYDDAENIGLKITGFGLDRDKHAAGRFIDDAVYCASEIKENHGDQCETYKVAVEFLRQRDEIVQNAPCDENGDFEDERELDNLLDCCEKEFLSDILAEYANILQRQYEYLISGDAIIETIEVNGYEFTEDGNRA